MTALLVSKQLVLPLDAVTETFALLAKRGAGKSNAAVVMAEQMHAAGLPWVAIDPKGDWWGVKSSSDGEGPGLPVVVLGGQHGDLPLEPTAGALVADLIATERFTAVVDVSLMSKADARRFLADFAERLYKANTEPLHVFAEEAHEYIPQRVTAGDARMVGAWEKLVKWGRTHGLGVTLITQRSASLNKDVLTQVETLIALRTTGPQDIAAVRAWVDEHETGKEVLAELRKLPNGDAYVLSPQWLELDEPLRITFHRRSTFDSGATPKAGQKRTTPKTLADVDLAAIKEAMAETVERAKADDPKALRARIRELEHQLADRPPVEPEIVEVPVLDDDAAERLSDAITPLFEHLTRITSALGRIAGDQPYARPQTSLPSRPAASTSTPTRPDPMPVKRAARGPAPAAGQGTPIALKKGARRMVEALGRMHPLRLTKGQWGTVSGLKTSGGTWSNYVADIRRHSLIDENSAGFTLTDAGFAYLGGRPDPMTATELQDHYRTVLKAGAVKILDTLMEAYPEALDREQIGQRAELAITGGTFSNYLGDLTRNGLAEIPDRGTYRATDLLMHGADL